jgi:protein MAK11
LITISLPATSSRKSTTLVCTASSDGMIHVYDLAGLGLGQKSAVQELEPVARYDSKGTRFTCLTVADVEPNENNILTKRKREEAEEADKVDEDDDEDDGDSVQYGSDQEEENEEEQELEEEDDDDDDDSS